MIAADGDEIASFAAAETPPSNIAVGEGAVWMLNTEDETVSRVDPETGEVAGTRRSARRADRHRGRRRRALDRHEPRG